MVNFSRQLVLFIVGLALLLPLPLSISAFAEPDRANLLNSNGFKIVGNQIDSAGVAKKEFSHLKAVVLEYKAKSIELEDILPSISTISSNDKKIVGVVFPPFVYFSKTF